MIMYDRILVRYGDLTLKGKNKRVFIERVNALIKEKVNNPNVKIEKNHDRLYLVLNGENYNKNYINHNQIMSGGVLQFTMGSSPNYNFGK